MTQKQTRLAQNSIALFVRMLLRLFVSVYTVRVIMNALGVEDYGIYNVVAGFTVMFGFFNSSMSAAASRFLSYDMGVSTSQSRLENTFRIVMTIQISVMLFVLLFGETVGLWFVNNKLTIPESRLFAANVIYQTSLLSMLFTIFQVPYNASLIAHEEMNVYAYIEVGYSIMLLLIAYLLSVFSDSDKLIIYGLLLMSVYATTSIVYYLFCKRKYAECRLGITLKWKEIRPVLLFSGWDLYANIGMSAYTQGLNVILNIFGSAVLNAAAGVGNQLYAALQMFSLSITTAVRPQIIKSYAAGDYLRMNKLINTGSRFLYLCVSIMAVPLIVKMDSILSIWLITPPNYAVAFARIILASQCVFASKSLFTIIMQATGEISRFSIMVGTFYILGIPMAFTFAKLGLSPTIIYGTVLFPIICYVIISLWEIHNKMRSFDDFSIKGTIISMLKGNVSLLISTIACYFIGIFFHDGFLSIVLYCVVSALAIFVIGYFIILGNLERQMLVAYTKKMLPMHLK